MADLPYFGKSAKTIQKLLLIKETLSEYYNKVKGEKANIFHILDLHSVETSINNRCPICEESDCAQFFTYYPRHVVEENGKTYTDFPIARFLCKKTKRTFSLLPYQLIPYRKYSIDFIFLALTKKYLEEESNTEVLNKLSGLDENDFLKIDTSQLADFRELAEESVSKLLATNYYLEFKDIISEANANKHLMRFIEFAKDFESTKTEVQIRGPCALSFDFYLAGGSSLQGAQFLFGTPSQFR